MYFVTSKRQGYTLFCMSPSEQFAVGVTERQVVHLLVRSGTEWQVWREWSGADYSHTAFMAALRTRAEPGDPRELLELLPPGLR